jgi:hypothetical protein
MSNGIHFGAAAMAPALDRVNPGIAALRGAAGNLVRTQTGVKAATANVNSAASSGEANSSHADRIVDELVNNFLRCSTTMSGIFRCW